MHPCPPSGYATALLVQSSAVAVTLSMALCGVNTEVHALSSCSEAASTPASHASWPKTTLQNARAGSQPSIPISP